MTDEHQTDEHKPLIPKTGTATGTVVVSIASIMGALGWIGTKLLSIDEMQVVHQEMIEMLQSENDEHHKDRLKLTEDVVRLQTEFIDLKEEQTRLREKTKEN
jgi:hypothetical protein